MTVIDSTSPSPVASTFGETSAAVAVHAIAHRYGERVALRDVSFSVNAGELVALLGPNGSGKSTLSKILSTLIAPTSGDATIGGCSVVRDPAAVRRRLGVTFQSPSIDVKLTLEENLTYHGQMYGLRGAALHARVDQSLREFDLAVRRHERAEALSGGLRRRLEIAKSLLHGPDVLLLDEPSTGLDPRARRALIELLDGRRRQRGTTCLLTTHLMDEAEACDRVAILDEGRLVAMDTPAALRQSVGGEVVTVHPARATGAAVGGSSRRPVPRVVETEPRASARANAPAQDDLPAAVDLAIGADRASSSEARAFPDDASSPPDYAESLRTRIAAQFGVDAALVAGLIRIEREQGHELAAGIAAAFGDEVESISVGRPTLEDVFVRLTGHRFEEPAGQSG